MRPSNDEVFMNIAKEVARRSTCLRRGVGCVLVNAKNHVIATGYNGVATGMPHCNEEEIYDNCKSYPHACKGAHAPSGTKLGECEAIHAEQNALLQCRNIYDIATCYVTASPCIHCMKLLLNTSCHSIVFIEFYDKEALTLWQRAGRSWSPYEHYEP